MRAIDTNVLVRLIVDEEQSAAAEHFARDGAWVSTLVLAEAAWVLTRLYNWKPAAVADAIEVLLDSESLVLQDWQAVARALGLFRGRPSLGLTDCLIIEIARQAGHLPVGTFDRKLSKAPGTEFIGR
jgi:predicted nucleic-acid-binding protein